MMKIFKKRITKTALIVLMLAALSLGIVTISSMFNSTTPANSSFEGVGDGMPVGWIKVSGNASLDDSVTYSGTASLKLEGVSSVVRQRYIPAIGGETYTIRANVKVSDSSANPMISATSYNGATCLDATMSASANQSFSINTWNELTLVYTAAPTATFIEVAFSSGNVDATVWIDSISIQGPTLVEGNHIKNGEFDSDASMWALSSNGYGTVSYDSTVGNGSMKITATNGNPSENNVGFSQDGIFVTPGKTYEISLNYMSTSANARPVIKGLTYLGGGEIGTEIESMTAETGTVASQWSEYKVEYTVPQYVPAMKLFITTLADRGTSVWFDDISVCEKTDSSFETGINIVNNSSFESDANWRLYGEGGGSATYDTTEAHTGNRSAKLSLTSKGRAFAQQARLQLNSEDKLVYRLSAWYRAVDVDESPYIRVNWNDADGAGIASTSVYVEKDEPKWVRLTYEVMPPDGAESVTIYPDIEATSGTLWFDDITFGPVTVPMTMTGSVRTPYNFDFENSSAWTFSASGVGSSARYDRNEKCGGNQSLRLSVSDDTQKVTATQFNVAATGARTVELAVNYKTANMVGNPYLKFMWYDKNDNFISSFSKTLVPSTEWTKGQMEIESTPMGAVKCAIILGIENGAGTVWFDDMTLGQYLTDADGHKHYVTNVVDITESFYAPEDDDPTNDDPQEFWNLFVPAKERATEVPNLWTEPFFRTAFFGNTGGQERGFALNAAPTVIKDDEALPVIEGSLGMSATGMPAKVIDPSIVGRPIMSPHTGYTDTYAPRREFDYVRLNYLPNYVMTGNEYFSTRAKELLTYLDYSQWKEGGRNAFVEDYYTSDPNAENKYVPRLEWRGAFTIFDWIWKDVPGYTWTYHEGDHHTNSLNVTSLVRAYELFGDEKYLDMAREFVYYQFPRYGFHTGEWNGQKYYWTEYSPTGLSVGNNVTDAVDNVVAHCGSAATMVGYYEKDPVLREQLLEFGRGCLWFLVREYSFDRRFWYDSAEFVAENWRKNVSHEASCIGEGALNAAYLYKAGVDISAALEAWEDIYREYPFTFGNFQNTMFLRMVKVYDGTPAAGAVLPFTTFFTPTSGDLTAVRFSDTIPEYGFEIPTELNIRFSRVTPPDSMTDDWHVDPDKDVVYTVTPAQLAKGIEFPFDVKCGEIYRATYELKVIDDPRFNREDVEDTNSEVTAWRIDEENNATFVNLTTGNSILLSENGATKPIAYDTTINSRNCLSYGSQLEFRFDREMASEFVDSPAPMVSAYLPTESWRGIEAEKYIYPAYSMAGSITNGVTFYPDYQSPSGGAFFVSLDDSVDFDFEVPLSNTEYTVDVLFNKARSRGVVDMLFNDIKQGETQNLYLPSSTWVAVCEWKSMGTVSLNQGVNKLSFTVVDKNPIGSTNPAFSEIVLTPIK